MAKLTSTIAFLNYVTDWSNRELNKVMEQELAKLKSKYRTLHTRKSIYTRTTMKYIEHQNKVLEGLEADQKNYECQLNLLNSPYNKTKDLQNIDLLQTASHCKDVNQISIKRERYELSALDVKILCAEKDLNDIKKNKPVITDCEQFYARINTKMRHLSNNLEKASQRLNICLADNRKRRDDIENLRIERKVYMRIFCCLMSKLRNMRHVIDETIADAISAFESRQENSTKLTMLQARVKDEKSLHMNDIQEYSRTVDLMVRYQQFMELKLREREMPPEVIAWIKKREMIKMANRQKMERNLEEYKTAYVVICNVTGRRDDFDSFVRYFITNESRNFSLYRFIDDQNDLIEEEQAKIKLILQQIERTRRLKNAVDDSLQRSLQELDDRKVRTSNEAKEVEIALARVSKTNEDLKNGIQSMFKNIKAEDNILGSSMGITDFNMLHYLAVIEEITNELCTLHHYINNVNSKNRDEIQPRTELVEGLSTQNLIVVIPPALIDDNEAIAVDLPSDEPLTRSKLLEILDKQKAIVKPTAIESTVSVRRVVSALSSIKKPFTLQHGSVKNVFVEQQCSVKKAFIEQKSSIKKALAEQQSSIKRTAGQQRSIKKALAEQQSSVKKASIEQQGSIKRASIEQHIEPTVTDSKTSIKEPINEEQSSIKEPLIEEQTSIKEQLIEEQSSIKEPHTEEQISIKEPHIEEQSSIKEPHVEEQRSIKDAHIEEQSSIKDPQIEEQSSIKEPHVEEQSSIKEQHIEEQSSIKEPYIEEQSSVKEPHMEEQSSIKEPYVEEQSSIKEPHVEEQSSIKEPHAEEQSSIKEPHIEEQSSIKEPHAEEQSSIKEPYIEEQCSIKEPFVEQQQSSIKEPFVEQENSIKEPFVEEKGSIKEPFVEQHIEATVKDSKISAKEEFIEHQIEPTEKDSKTTVEEEFIEQQIKRK